jgi:hypothetical protein
MTARAQFLQEMDRMKLTPTPRLGGTATILVLLDRVVIAPVIDGAISTPQT